MRLSLLAAAVALVLTTVAAFAFHGGGGLFFHRSNDTNLGTGLGGGGGGGGTSTPFTALHTYFMAPSGSSDSYDGLSATFTGGSHGPWATPNHAVVCGDVIIAAAGTYGGQNGWGAVSGCPSSSGGIDGNGGIYFATMLCGGSYVGACAMTSQSWMVSSNWSVQGFAASTGNTGGSGRAFQIGSACTGITHHYALINDIAYNSASGFHTEDCGSASYGPDYVAIIGSIAQNAAQFTGCEGAIDAVGVNHIDATTGVHVFFYGNFSYNNNTGSCANTGGTDMEDYMFDTWDTGTNNYTGVIANNIGFNAARMCIQWFQQNKSANTATLKIYRNTCFNDNLNSGTDNMDGEINITSTVSPLRGAYVTYENIAFQPNALTPGGTGGVAAFVLGIPFGSSIFSLGGTGVENFYEANNSSCKPSATCSSDGKYSTQSYGGALQIGTDLYGNPTFNNTTDLLANQLGAPNCSGYLNTTQCMGWNAGTSSMTNPSIIYDLQPTAAGTTGKGYQPPSTTCSSQSAFTGSISGTTLTVSGGVTGDPLSLGQQIKGASISANTYVTAGSGTSWTVSNSQTVGSESMTADDYPYWLKGIVYLHWDGSALTERADLVTKPCAM